MPRYTDALRLVREALAAESGCQAEDLHAPAVQIFERPEGMARPVAARRYPAHRPAFAALSMGRGAVISTSQELLPAITPILRALDRDQVFEPERLGTVNALLRPFGLTTAGPYHRLVCGGDTLRERQPPANCRIEIEVSPSIERLRELGSTSWPHAISRREVATSEIRTTALALAFCGEGLVGVASISADSKQLWQIGIDVAEPFQGRGIGAALTAQLGRHALAMNRIPWYGVAPANLASLNTALAAGFRLAWLEVFTVSVERSSQG